MMNQHPNATVSVIVGAVVTAALTILESLTDVDVDDTASAAIVTAVVGVVLLIGRRRPATAPEAPRIP